jgi:hypothetical protein
MHTSEKPLAVTRGRDEGIRQPSINKLKNSAGSEGRIAQDLLGCMSGEH